MTMNPPSNHEDENTQEDEHLEQNWVYSFTQMGLYKDCYTFKKKKKKSCFISKITLFGDLFIITAEIDLSQFVQFVGAYNLLQKQA